MLWAVTSDLMAPGLDDYQPFFDAIRNADRELTAAQAEYDWSRWWDPRRYSTYYDRLERARTTYRHTVENLVAYVLQ